MKKNLFETQCQSAIEQLPIDTMSLTINYSNGAVDYVELRKKDAPIREKMYSSLKNHINFEIYIPKALSQETWIKMLRSKLALYGFSEVDIMSCGTFRSRKGLFSNLIADLFTTVSYDYCREA